MKKTNNAATTPHLTRWISGRVKPAHVGVYQTKPDGSTTFQHWDGNQWGYCARSVDSALSGIGYRSCVQSAPWRGLASDPSKGA